MIDLRPKEKASKERKEKKNETEVKKVAEMEVEETDDAQGKFIPLTCVVSAWRRLFCGCGNDVVVLQFGKDGKLEIERRWSVEDCQKGLVLNIAVGLLVWVSTRDSTQLDTWEPSQAVYRGSVDCKVILEASGNTQDAHDLRVVSLLLQQRKHQLWIGLGSGYVILINPMTKEPLRIIRRHVSTVRCMEACSGPAFGKPLSLVMTGGMGFIEGPMCSQNKSNVDFGHVLIWEADVGVQIKYLESYRKRRQEYVSSNRLSDGRLRRKSVVDLHDIGCQSLVHLRRKSVI